MLTDFIFDPVVTRVFASTLAIILLVGAWQKLRDIDTFAVALENYRLLAPGLVYPTAWFIPGVEMIAGSALIFPESCAVGALLAAALLTVVTCAVAINLLRGRRNMDCGCGGLSNQPISWALVARNLILVVLTVPASQQSVGRSLYWGDYFTLGGGVLALIGLYLCANQLLNNSTSTLINRN